jgi:hypothetical protein
MTDQCKNCDLHGKINECLSTECFQHENWYAIKQQNYIDRMAAVLSSILAHHDVSEVDYEGMNVAEKLLEERAK